MPANQNEIPEPTQTDIDWGRIGSEQDNNKQGAQQLENNQRRIGRIGGSDTTAIG
jgi:hypothetical protein